MLLINIARAGIRLGNISVYFTRLCPKCNISAFSQVKTVKLYSTQTKPLHEVNTNVAKDVILFNYENPRFYKIMNIFALVQYGFWAYLASFAYTSLRDAPVDPNTIDENTPWLYKINMGEKKYKNGLTIFSLLVGVSTLLIVWTLTLRSVRYLILHKGGKHISVVTYTPVGKNRIMKVPIEDVSCKESRQTARVQIPLKVRNRRLHYILDVKGEFKNGPLFDYTAGLHRKL